MQICGASVFGEDFKFHEEDIRIRDGVFAPSDESASPDNGAAGQEEEIVLRADDCYAIPGLIDIHFHGALNADVCDEDPAAFEKIAAYEASAGITAICPATLTLPVPVLEHVLSLGAAFAAAPHPGADLVGFNMEGPFISRVKRGAQNEKYIMRCDVQTAERFYQASGGLLKIIGLAPEENPGFEAFIRNVRKKMRVSLAHTNADYDTAMQAFSAGASHAVHLYNAMSGLNHREPGVVGAVSDSPSVFAEIITDGIHVHPAAVRAAFRMNGEERMVLISDSLRCTGMPDGDYLLGGQTVVKKGRHCTLKKEGNLAGSVSNLADCMRTAVLEMNIPLETAVRCASINPARAIGIDDRRGSIEAGKRADVVLLRKDSALSLAAVVKDGKVIVNHL